MLKGSRYGPLITLPTLVWAIGTAKPTKESKIPMDGRWHDGGEFVKPIDFNMCVGPSLACWF